MLFAPNQSFFSSQAPRVEFLRPEHLLGVDDPSGIYVDHGYEDGEWWTEFEERPGDTASGTAGVIFRFRIPTSKADPLGPYVQELRPGRGAGHSVGVATSFCGCASGEELEPSLIHHLGGAGGFSGVGGAIIRSSPAKLGYFFSSTDGGSTAPTSSSGGSRSISDPDIAFFRQEFAWVTRDGDNRLAPCGWMGDDVDSASVIAGTTSRNLSNGAPVLRIMLGVTAGTSPAPATPEVVRLRWKTAVRATPFPRTWNP